MPSDIVERLREFAVRHLSLGYLDQSMPQMVMEAADEIKRLRRENEALRGMQARWTAVEQRKMQAKP